jgi:predicted nucleic acid-binding protein
MRILLDTCAVGELRTPRGNPAVRTAIARIPAGDLFLSVLIVGELARGIALLTDRRRQRNLSFWLSWLQTQFADRILAVDHETAHRWGDICARVQQAGLVLSPVDGLLAATALRHGLYVMTHTTIALAATGALIFDPWQESDGEPQTE